MGNPDRLHDPQAERTPLGSFRNETVERLSRTGNVWKLPHGKLMLPEVFGFCRGVKRALVLLAKAVAERSGGPGRLFLLGQIIHNPWVNQFFREQGVRVLAADELACLDGVITAEDWAVIPAFGVPPDVQRRLEAIGCRTIDTSCGDVRRLWGWVEHTVARGFAVLIFGRARHDETIVTKSRLAEAGGQYVVAGSLDEVRQFCRLVAASPGPSPAEFLSIFHGEATNAESIGPFSRLAQVSQTTMLYDETMKVRKMLGEAFERRFGPDRLERRLIFEPTVCRATQDRQSAAVELCKAGLDLAVVVGGYGSSNTMHLYELACEYAPAVFIEDAGGIISRDEVRSMDPAGSVPVTKRDWLPSRRPLRVGVLAGASSPEVVIGQVLERLAEFLR